jgi:hypothetical protein
MNLRHDLVSSSCQLKSHGSNRHCRRTYAALAHTIIVRVVEGYVSKLAANAGQATRGQIGGQSEERTGVGEFDLAWRAAADMQVRLWQNECNA